MKKNYENRKDIDLESLFKANYENEASYEYFYKAWKAISSALNYPRMRCMRVEDRLEDLMRTNNSSFFYSEFDDEYEVISFIDINLGGTNLFYLAVDSKLQIETVDDILRFILKERGNTMPTKRPIVSES